jgi:soluble lytic murein transglycosylase-like protein
VTSAQRVIDDPRSSPGALQTAGRFEQLATRELDLGSSRLRVATLADLSGAAAASMRANLAAADALTALVTPQPRLPHWRIIAPPAPLTLLSYFRTAQARYRVPWEDLAAVEFVETRFGRIRGLSTAGAEGPMQFLPATWARYGKGDVNDPSDAILGAARFLVANGARRSIGDALYHYNPSRAYVRAVEIYAGRMRADARAFFGYYNWQVFYDHLGGSVILPEGFPRVRPIPLG